MKILKQKKFVSINLAKNEFSRNFVVDLFQKNIGSLSGRDSGFLDSFF